MTPEVVSVVPFDGDAGHEVLQLREGVLHARGNHLTHYRVHLRAHAGSM